MLIVRGKKFARNTEEFTNSLFEKGSTCVGFYKVLKSGIRFSDMHSTPFAFLRVEKSGNAFFVSCVKRDKGYWYSYGISEAGRKLLGIEGLSYSEEQEEARRVAEAVYSKEEERA